MKILLSLFWTFALVWALTFITAHVQPSDHYFFAWAMTVAVAYLAPLWWIWK